MKAPSASFNLASTRYLEIPKSSAFNSLLTYLSFPIPNKEQTSCTKASELQAATAVSDATEYCAAC